MRIATTLAALFATVATAAGVENYHMGCHTWPVPPKAYGPTNDLPIGDYDELSTLVKTSEYAKLYEVQVPNAGGNTSSSFYVTHVYGTPYQWGYGQGVVLKDEIVKFITDMWKYLESQVTSALPHVPKFLADLIADVGLDAALDTTYKWTREYTDSRIWEELHGMADATGLDYMMSVRVHMLAGLTQGKCSMMGAWGSAVSQAAGASGAIQLRALDWDMDAPVRDHSAITVYHPAEAGDGHAFANMGMIGFIGSLTGMSEAQLGLSEIGVDYPGTDGGYGSESRVGVPFIFIIREVLQYDTSIEAATSRMESAKRTCDLILGVGDGKEKRVMEYLYSSGKLVQVTPENNHPRNDTWHPALPDTVYAGMDYWCPSFNDVLHAQLKQFHGQLTPELMIRNVSAVEQSGDNHVAIYDLTNQFLYASFAAPRDVGGPSQAYARQYVKLNTAALFAEPQPSKSIAQK